MDLREMWIRYVQPEVLALKLYSDNIITHDGLISYSILPTDTEKNKFLFTKILVESSYESFCRIKAALRETGGEHMALADMLPSRPEEVKFDVNFNNYPEPIQNQSEPRLSLEDLRQLTTTITSHIGGTSNKTGNMGAAELQQEKPEIDLIKKEGQAEARSYADVDIYKEYQEFRKKRFEPDYIQRTYSNRSTGKIHIDVDREHVQEATQYFKLNFKEFWDKNILKIVGQAPLVYFGKERVDEHEPEKKKPRIKKANIKPPYRKDTDAAAGDGQSNYKQFIEAGGVIMPSLLTEEEMGPIRSLADLNEAIKMKTGQDTPSGTCGGFLQDDKGNIYMLTARHVLKGFFETKPNGEERVNLNPGIDIKDCLSVITEIYPEPQPSQIVVIGNEYYACCAVLPESKKGLDFALVKVCQNTRQNPQTKFNPVNPQNESVQLNVYRGSDDDMHNNKVHKDGKTTGLTKGKVLSITGDQKFKDFPSVCSGTFAVESIFSGKGFAEPGDSGALITSDLDVSPRDRGEAFGIVFAGQPEYIYTDDEGNDTTYTNITWGLRLDNSLSYAEKVWGIKGLRFIEGNNVSLSVQPLAASGSLFDQVPQT